jgi:hypothetical protein
MICNISVPQNLNDLNKERSRPRIDILFGANKSSWLFDTGASRTCMPESTFRKMFSTGNRPEPLPKKNSDLELQDAGGNDLGMKGIYLLDMNINGRRVQHEVVVLTNLTDSILGADFMHRHHISYNAYTRSFNWADQHESWTNAVFSANEHITIPALQTKVVKVNTVNDQGQACTTETEAIAFIHSQNPYLTNQPGLVKFNSAGNTFVRIQNCAPFDISIARNEKLGFMENCSIGQEIAALNDEFLDKILTASETSTVPDKLTWEQKKNRIKNEANINVPAEYREEYLALLTKYSDLFSDTKYDLGRATHFFHKIHLKDKEPVYRKQFKIPDAHKPFLEENITEWLKLGVIQRSQSLYNSPVFCVPKKDGSLRIVQDFRELNKHSYMDKYSMKEINECIGDIGRAKSTIFTTLDLTSGFWQMPLEEHSRAPTAFTIPGLGQFEWVTSPMGLLGCPASFQRLMEMIFRNIKNVIVYIDDLLIHSKTHKEHLEALEESFKALRKSSMKISLKKCFFGSQEVSYLGFRLTPNGILPGKDKLKAIQKAPRPKTVTEIKAFLGLCNFFRTHIKNFSMVASPLYGLTRKDKNFDGTYSKEENEAFDTLKKSLCSEPVMAYPTSDRTYGLLVDAATGTADKPGGLGAILTQIDDKGVFHAISYASRQLVTHEKNYSPYLLEMQAAVWGMDYFQEHLRGKRFILYTDHKPLEALSHIHTKTLNRLQTAMMDFDFEIQYKKGIEMPADFLSRATVDEINAINPFNEDLPALQRQCSQSKMIIEQIYKVLINPTQRIKDLADTCFIDQSVLWKKISAQDSWDAQPRTVLFVPTKLRRQLICEAHGKLLTGHNGIQKTKERLLTSYFWPNMDFDISNHIKSCLQCQMKDKMKKKPSPLQSLPTCSAPNQRVHLDLFGAVKSSSNKNNYILCMTDAFTKYAEVVAIPNKEAPTVAAQFFDKWICRYGVPSQIHTDGGKEFVNKLSKELCEKLEIKHTKNSAYHPQCNAQVEVFNKTVQKYLTSVVDPSTLDWELYLAPLMFSYNTSFHATIKASPFQLTFGMDPRLPSFPAADLKIVHYGEGPVSQHLQTLQRARQIAAENIVKSGLKSEENFNKKALPKPNLFKKDQLILLNNPVFTSKNKKFCPKWIGPMPITKIISEKVVEVQFQDTKRKHIVNVDRIKPFVQKIHQPDSEEEIYNNIPEDSIETDPKEILPPKPVLSEKEKDDEFHIPKKRARKQKIQNNSNPRITRSAAKLLPDFQHEKLNVVNEISIQHSTFDETKSTLRQILIKQFKFNSITQNEQNFLTSISKRNQNLILTGHPDEHWDVKDALTHKIHFGLSNQGPLLNRTRSITDHGYMSQATEPSDPSEPSDRSPDVDLFEEMPDLEDETSESEADSDETYDQADSDLEASLNQLSTVSTDDSISNSEESENEAELTLISHRPKTHPLPTDFKDLYTPESTEVSRTPILQSLANLKFQERTQDSDSSLISADSSFRSAESSPSSSPSTTPVSTWKLKPNIVKNQFFQANSDTQRKIQQEKNNALQDKHDKKLALQASAIHYNNLSQENKDKIKAEKEQKILQNKETYKTLSSITKGFAGITTEYTHSPKVEPRASRNQKEQADLKAKENSRKECPSMWTHQDFCQKQ